MTSEIDRDTWVEFFKRGFKRGASERKKRPENRHEELGSDKAAESESEIAALDAGYELGKQKAHPGASIDIEEQANTAYDRSEYSAGLDRWS